MPFQRTLRMTPYLSFHLRSKREEGPVMLYCRLSFRDQRTTEYKTNILVESSLWPNLPDSHPGTGPVRIRIAQIRAEHDWIALQQPNPTANSIKTEWQTSKGGLLTATPKSISLLESYGKYVAYKMKPPTRKPLGWRPYSQKTIDRLVMSGKHLGAYLKFAKQLKLSLPEVRANLGYQFADYLFDQGIGADTVSRHVYNVVDALDYAVRCDEIESNTWAGVSIKGSPPKRIDYLNELDLIRLSALDLHGIYDTVRNWALLMCYTGLDYNDALKITKNPGTYYKQTADGDVLVFQRLKYDHAPQWGECHIPVLSMTRQLLADVLGWERPRLKVINTHLKTIGTKLNLSFKFKSKHCRKSAALVMLLHYDNIYVVQKVLGHQSIKTTEKCYVNMPPEIVYKAMRKNPVTI